MEITGEAEGGGGATCPAINEITKDAAIRLLQYCFSDDPELHRCRKEAAQDVRNIEKREKINEALAISLKVSFTAAF